jgi:excisionase family DNA binding protein
MRSLTTVDVNFYNRQEAAQYLGISLGTLRHLVNERLIGYGRVSERVRFTKRQLDEYLASNEVPAQRRSGASRRGRSA